MKSKDIAVIVGICVVSAIFSYVVAGFVFGGEDSQNLEAPIVQPITAEFPDADPRHFNANSLNPTQTITIGDDINQEPF